MLRIALDHASIVFKDIHKVFIDPMIVMYEFLVDLFPQIHDPPVFSVKIHDCGAVCLMIEMQVRQDLVGIRIAQHGAPEIIPRVPQNDGLEFIDIFLFENFIVNGIIAVRFSRMNGKRFLCLSAAPVSENFYSRIQLKRQPAIRFIHGDMGRTLPVLPVIGAVMRVILRCVFPQDIDTVILVPKVVRIGSDGYHR